ncbi:hypothetical protein Stsp01_01400 [Streptomyces sp. NBRC 13847]|nr:hypothetical protein Stsp01_01400 [Streptomyces sp. NBRC 13847]
MRGASGNRPGRDSHPPVRRSTSTTGPVRPSRFRHGRLTVTDAAPHPNFGSSERGWLRRDPVRREVGIGCSAGIRIRWSSGVGHMHVMYGYDTARNWVYRGDLWRPIIATTGTISTTT